MHFGCTRVLSLSLYVWVTHSRLCELSVDTDGHARTDGFADDDDVDDGDGDDDGLCTCDATIRCCANMRPPPAVRYYDDVRLL